LSKIPRANLIIIICGGVLVWLAATRAYARNPLADQLGSKITLAGTVADDPARSDKGHLEFSLGNLTQDGRPIRGDIRVRTYYVHLKRGYRLQATGKLEPTLGSKLAQFGFASVKILSTDQNAIERLRQRFIAGMYTALPDRLAGLVLGLLIGSRALISKPLQDQLAAVGLSHIVAVSGYNLTIIVQAVRRPLARRWRWAALVLPLWLIAGFMLVAGFSASIMRAAAVSGLSLLAAHYGRRFQPLVLIGLAAAGTAAVNPRLMIDLGWQLSFLAFFGILVLAPAIQARFIKRPNTLNSLICESLAAQLMTFPLIAFAFGRLSLVSPLANLLVLPLVPVTMLAGWLAGLAGWFLPVAAGWIALPAALLSQLILTLTDWLSRWRLASQHLNLSRLNLAGLYAAISLAGLALRRRLDRASKLV
jgi:competence protein ComEC